MSSEKKDANKNTKEERAEMLKREYPNGYEYGKAIYTPLVELGDSALEDIPEDAN